MKQHLHLLPLLLTLLLVPSALRSQDLNDDYAVTILPEGSDQWQSLTTYRCDVDMHSVQHASFAAFDLAVPTRVRVVTRRDLGGPLCVVQVRPFSKRVAATIVNDSTAEFTLTQPAYLSVEFNSDARHNLHLFADEPLAETYTGTEPRCINWGDAKNNQDVYVKDARLIYFGPGLHKVKDMVMGEETGDIKIPSNTTVFLAPGAVVLGKLVVDRVENVRIVGRGMLLHPLRGVEITHSKNVLVDGITFVNPKHYTIYGGESRNITIRNIKSFSRHGWSDGIDLMSCRHVTIDNVFLRNSDDCIALYNHRWRFWGDTKDVRITRATLWADVAHPFSIGGHGDDRSRKGEVISDVRVSDCDVLNEDGDGVFSIRVGDGNHVRDIHFSDIRIESIERGGLFNLQVVFSEKYNRKPGGSLRDVWFTDISYSYDNPRISPSIIRSYDADHAVRDIHFRNVRVNGLPLVTDHFEPGSFDIDTPARTSFVHPGLLLADEDIAAIRRLQDDKGSELQQQTFAKLAADAKSSYDYVMRGPFRDIARDDEFRATKAPCESDCNAAWNNTLMYLATGDPRHAATARTILRAYADTLQAIHGHDGPLCAGLQGFLLVNAAEVLRATYPQWTADDTQAFAAMVRRAILPVLLTFQERRAYSNGNWGAAVNKSLMACAIFLDDRALYDRSTHFYLHGRDNGALPKYIAAGGQLQESGRDQAHCQLGLGCLAELCEMAWHQGDDLYGACANRLLAGYEYTARYNLGHDVPFFQWEDLTGFYCDWTVISDKARGQWRTVWELPVRHYVKRRGLDMPYSQQVLSVSRPEAAAPWCDHAGYPSLWVGED